MYCLPVLKRGIVFKQKRFNNNIFVSLGNPHRLALLSALKSEKFFLGTDSAPHATETKENSCGCAGIFSAYNALELYLDAFEEAEALEHFHSFCCVNGAKFYNLPLSSNNKTKVYFEKRNDFGNFHFKRKLTAKAERR